MIFIVNITIIIISITIVIIFLIITTIIITIFILIITIIITVMIILSFTIKITIMIFTMIVTIITILLFYAFLSMTWYYLYFFNTNSSCSFVEYLSTYANLFLNMLLSLIKFSRIFSLDIFVIVCFLIRLFLPKQTRLKKVKLTKHRR